jgi:multidrug efflux system membrane fusion protein
MNTLPADSLTAAPAPKSRVKLWILGFILLAGAGGAYWYFERATPVAQEAGRRGPGGFGGPFGGGGGGFGRNQVVPVRVVAAQRQNIEVTLRALGTVTPLNTVTVRPRLDGELTKVHFTEGQRVQRGQVLAEIDARPYEVQLAQAEGALEENRARLKNAESDLERYQALSKEQLITGQQVVGAEAQVRQLKGAIQGNEAQVSSARLNLAYAKVVAPLDGRLGLRQVDPGNIVRSGDANGLVVITQMRPISVIFTVPEADLPAVLDAMRANRRLAVEAWDRSDAVKLASGALHTVDNQIDTTTGTIKLRAQFDNGDEKLFPNQFVNIRLGVRTIQNTIAIPSAAVQRAAFGTFVYVVGDNNKVSIQRIGLGPTEGERVAVTTGLPPNAKVVLEGVDQLTEGATVEIVPEAGAAPTGPIRPRDGAGRGRGPGATGQGGGRRGGAGPGGSGPGGGGQGGGPRS